MTDPVPNVHPWHADGLSCIVVGLQGDLDAMSVMLDDMSPQQLRYVAQAAVNVALFNMTGGGFYTPTPEQWAAMIAGYQEQIAALRAQAEASQ